MTPKCRTGPICAKDQAAQDQICVHFHLGIFPCHGAPGIALSRLRAYEVLNDAKNRAEAVVGLAATRRAVDSQLEFANSDFCLCHGLAGNAEVLLYGHKILGAAAEGRKSPLCGCLIPESNDTSSARTSGRAASEVEENPSLMVGMAGIGHFYLRLGAPQVPEVVIFRRAEQSRRISP